jgi:DNA-binding PadR family transcriptional regulator
VRILGCEYYSGEEAGPVAKRRKVGNILALAVLMSLAERPMHPYEVATMLRERGKDYDMKINWGSLYTVVQNLARHGFIEATGTTREGRRPERTVYGITAAGREELRDWVRELVGQPEREHPQLETALSTMGVLPPDEAVELLGQRMVLLERRLEEERAMVERVAAEVPRLFLIEAEYRLAMWQAEVEWLRGLLAELVDGTFPGMSMWAEFHRAGVQGQQREEGEPPG